MLKHPRALWPLVWTYLTVWQTDSVWVALTAGPSPRSCSQLVTCCCRRHQTEWADRDEEFTEIRVSLAHVQLYEEVAVWSPSELRKWSGCKASGSRNPVGHLPCCSCVAPLQNPPIHPLSSPCVPGLHGYELGHNSTAQCSFCRYVCVCLHSLERSSAASHTTKPTWMTNHKSDVLLDYRLSSSASILSARVWSTVKTCWSVQAYKHRSMSSAELGRNQATLLYN